MLTNPIVIIPTLGILFVWILSRPKGTSLKLKPNHRKAALDYHAFRDRHALRKGQQAAAAKVEYGPLSRAAQEKYQHIRARMDETRKAA